MSAPAYAPLMAHLLVDLMPEGAHTREVVDALDAALASDSVVVEVGCGYGRVLLALAARGHRCVGLEQSAFLADRARDDAAARGLRVDVRCGDAIDLLDAPCSTGSSDPSACADAVLVVGGTLTLFDPASRSRLLGACAGRLRPGGRLFVDLHDADEVRRAHPGGGATRTFATRRGPVEARCTLEGDVWSSVYRGPDGEVVGTETHHLLDVDALLAQTADVGLAPRAHVRGWSTLRRPNEGDPWAGRPRPGRDSAAAEAHVVVLERSAS